MAYRKEHFGLVSCLFLLFSCGPEGAKEGGNMYGDNFLHKLSYNIQV
ncbi:hypothetical protein [Cyclobacterium salsum]|nr:hypothetical protein [Cyclobacterium salsum]